MIRLLYSSPCVLSAPLRLLIVVMVLRSWGGVCGEEAPKPLWLVVGPADLAKPIGPLAEHRRQEGFQVVVSTRSVEEALGAVPRRPEFLLLLGDDEPGKQAAAWYLPARQMKLYRWSHAQREQFASDAVWGDLDGDLIPEVAVGRIPARTAAEVELAVNKILAFERRPASLADLNLPVWAGSPQFGPLIDGTATGLLLLMVRTTGPNWATPWIITGNPNHPLSGWPPDQPTMFSRQIAKGSVCTTLMGHGTEESFFSMTHRGRPVQYTAAGAQQKLSKGPPIAPMVFFCCRSGDFARSAPCLTEALFFMPGGPVATIGATTESHPLTNYFSGACLLRELGGRQDRIGSIWLAAQRRAIKQRNFLIERILLDVEGKLEQQIDQAKLRRDQMLMYAVLGDPATRLKMPKPLEASLRRVENGWRWTAKMPQGARGLAVGHRPSGASGGQWTEAPTDRQKALAAFQSANAELGFVVLPSPPEAGPWQGTVEQPGWLRLVTVAEGDLHVAVLTLK